MILLEVKIGKDYVIAVGVVVIWNFEVNYL